MRVRTITAKDMQDAMRTVRAELGDSAVILSSQQEGDFLSVTIGIEDQNEPELAPWDEERPQFGPKNEVNGHHHAAILPIAPRSEAAELLHELMEYHRFSGALQQQCLKIADTLKAPTPDKIQELQHFLTQILQKLLSYDPFLDEHKGERLIFVGTPGVGKTMAIAKTMAASVIRKEAVMVITTDTKRPGSIEQLSSLAQILRINLKVASDRHDLRGLLKGVDKQTRVLIDSAGVNPYSFQELKELGDYASLSDIEPILILSAGTDAGEAEEIASVFSFLDIERMIITRMDASRRYGSVLSAALAGDYKLASASWSSSPAADLKPLDASRLAHALLQFKREKLAP